MTNTSNKIRKSFTISYDFPSTKGHLIDAEELANNLLSMTKLIKEADKISNGESSEVSVEVAAHKPGSFEVEIVAWLYAGGIDVISQIGIGAGLTAFSGSTVFNALKQLKNRTIIGKTRNSNGDGYILELQDGETITVSDEALPLVENHSIRKHIDDVFHKPLLKEKDAKVIIKTTIEDEGGNEEAAPDIEFDAIVTAEFKAPPKKEFQEVEETEFKSEVRFTQVNFESKSGWKAFIKDDKPQSVKMEDEAFLERINNKKKSFIKGELFVVKLRETTTTIDDSVKTSLAIIEVIRHRTEKSKKLI
ncbi:hypothetical protein [uncultured Psychrosphaera sp.]|uniref:hypothetical protein n=1 Tax=uncultured Psychrosphaera sp. TaxID=1403522 RepID=UPI00260E7D0F|nr:hypothetical protein [uncultured Psychrosphaera sp.]